MHKPVGGLVHFCYITIRDDASSTCALTTSIANDNRWGDSLVPIRTALHVVIIQMYRPLVIECNGMGCCNTPSYV